MKRLVDRTVVRLLSKNLSKSQLAAFTLCGFIGLAIVTCAVQIYIDLYPVWEDEDSFIRRDYLIVNKKITSAVTLGDKEASFSDEEIKELEGQPWVRKVGRFESADYYVNASVQTGSRGMSTNMFFESIPDEFLDKKPSGWFFDPKSERIPIIVSKDYLTLYNFGFASSAGLPKITENMMGGMPLHIVLQSERTGERLSFEGKVVGFSNRLNTILVPESFMDWSNKRLGKQSFREPSRIIVDVNRPGDVAINKFMEDRDYEIAGDKEGSSASFLLNVVAGVIIVIGSMITVLSFFVLMLSISLLMQKNHAKIHSLLMLGYDLSDVRKPYEIIVLLSTVISFGLALFTMFSVRAVYFEPVLALGGCKGSIIVSVLTLICITVLIVCLNFIAVAKRVQNAWR